VPTITAAGQLLTADANARVLTYRLLPYGEEGHTSVGRITASAGVLDLPADPATMHLNIEHDRGRPVGRGITLTEEPSGLVASFAISRTTSGDDLLTEAVDGLRPGASVEILDPVIRAGQLIGGQLVHAGAVTQPAFPSALLVAADAGTLPTPDTGQTADTSGVRRPVSDAETGQALSHLDDTTDDDPADPATEADDDTDPAFPDPPADLPPAGSTDLEEPPVTTSPAAAPADLRASASTGSESRTASEVFALIAQAHATKDPVLLAALADITQSGIAGDLSQSQWLGELWSGRAFARQVVPMLNHGDLTSFKVDGWRWVTKPTVDTWTGDKTAVPSNAVDTEPQSVPATRIAGAHDIDRIFRDFDVSGFWESYYRAMTESYARKSDAAVTADLIAAAPAVEAGTVPAGVSKGMVMIVDGALSIIDTAVPSFAIVGSDLYRDILLTRSDDVLAYLNAALGLEDGTVGSFRIVPSSASALAGKVLVGAREAATVHELSGSPIRAEALDISKGGVDTGLFGYLAVVFHDEDALALVADLVP
jgi:hypothetical protein